MNLNFFQIKRYIFLIFVFVFFKVLMSGEIMANSIKVEKPFLKAYVNAQGVKYQVVVNGALVKVDKSKNSHSIEIPINQYVRSGENKLELQLNPLNKKGDLSKMDSAFIDVEFRLYTTLNQYVVLSELKYYAKDSSSRKLFSGVDAGRYSVIANNKIEPSKDGIYIVSDVTVEVIADKYNETHIFNIVSFPMPFGEWNFLKGDVIPDPKNYESDQEIIDNVVGVPFSIVEKIHSFLSKKDIDSILPLFKERNNEMDMAFYYDSGTYEKMFRGALLEDFNNGMILADLDINISRPIVSPGYNLLKLGTDSILYFHDTDKSVFNIYEIFFRKEGGKWIISR